MARSSQSYKEFLEEYKREIFVMLHCLGYDRSEAAALIKSYAEDISVWAGNNPGAGPIVTPEMAARALSRYLGDGRDGL